MADQSLLGALYQTGLTIWQQRKARRVSCPVCKVRARQRCDTRNADPPIPVHQERVDIALGRRCYCGYVKHENTTLIPSDRCPSCGSAMWSR